MQHIFNSTGHELFLPNIIKGEGNYIFDDSGKKYLDLTSGVWCTSIGHNHPRFKQVVEKQMNLLTHAGFCYNSPIVNEAAANLLSITGHQNGKVVFLSSGSEAVEYARQASRALTGKSITMTLHDSYLGAYSSTIDRKDGWYLFDWTQCRKCANADNCNVNCPLLKAIPADISEFIFEPGSSGGFVRFPSNSLIRNIVSIVRKNGGKIIANEVTTGIGQTGKWFGFNHYDIMPDIVAMGKGLGSGYPVSAVSMSENVINKLVQTDFHYSQSHQNDPLGAAIANEVIEVIRDEKLLEASITKSEFLEAKLSKLIDSKIVTEIRGRGLMYYIEIPDENVCNEIYIELINRGFITCLRKMGLRIDAPLTITLRDLELFIDCLELVLKCY